MIIRTMAETIVTGICAGLGAAIATALAGLAKTALIYYGFAV